jgi:hypothetical protein
MKSKKTKERAITGIVVPEDWDPKNNVIGVAIKTSDYTEYVVERNNEGKGLLAFVDKKVRVRGMVRERLDGDLIITVKSYEPIEGDDENNHVI